MRVEQGKWVRREQTAEYSQKLCRLTEMLLIVDVVLGQVVMGVGSVDVCVAVDLGENVDGGHVKERASR